MYEGRTIFSQILDFLPRKSFRTCVKRYNGNYRIRSFSCYEQYLCMAFAQLTYHESLRDTVLCLRAMRSKLHHVGIQSRVAKSIPLPMPMKIEIGESTMILPRS